MASSTADLYKEKLHRCVEAYLLKAEEQHCQSCLKFPHWRQVCADMIAKLEFYFAQASASSSKFVPAIDMRPYESLLEGKPQLAFIQHLYSADVLAKGSQSGSWACCCGTKNEQKALKLLDAANILFSEHNFVAAVEQYTSGLMYAPMNEDEGDENPKKESEEPSKAALAYGNRSATFFRLRQYEAALADIERAMALGYRPEERRFKLTIRKAECLIKLGRRAEATKLFESEELHQQELQRKIHLQEIEQMQKTANGIYSVEAQNNNGLPDPSSSVPSLNTKLFDLQWKRLKATQSKIASFDNLSSTSAATVDLRMMDTVEKVVAVLITKGLFSSTLTEKDENNSLLQLSSKVKLFSDKDENKGFLVAKEVIKAGEIIAVLKPFAILQLEDNEVEDDGQSGDQRQKRCHHCMVACFKSAALLSPPPSSNFASHYGNTVENTFLVNDNLYENVHIRLHTPVPCHACSRVLFCSEKCRTEAWTTYHQFECGQLHLLGEKLGTEAHLALRMLYASGGFENVRKVFEKIQKEALDFEEKENAQEDLDEYGKLVSEFCPSSVDSFAGEWTKINTSWLLVHFLKGDNNRFIEVSLQGWKFFALFTKFLFFSRIRLPKTRTSSLQCSCDTFCSLKSTL